jgi:recombinational DNA repair ATPase RecF
VQDLNDKFAESEMKYERTIKDKNHIIQLKDDEIAGLKTKMDEMAEEFGDMLRETLDKMRERIEVTSGNFDADIPIQNRMEEMKTAATNESKGDY